MVTGISWTNPEAVGPFAALCLFPSPPPPPWSLAYPCGVADLVPCSLSTKHVRNSNFSKAAADDLAWLITITVPSQVL